MLQQSWGSRISCRWGYSIIREGLHGRHSWRRPARPAARVATSPAVVCERHQVVSAVLVSQSGSSFQASRAGPDMGTPTTVQNCPPARGRQQDRARSTRLVRAATMTAGTPGPPRKRAGGRVCAISPSDRVHSGQPFSPPSRQAWAYCSRQPSLPVATLGRRRWQRGRILVCRRPMTEAAATGPDLEDDRGNHRYPAPPTKHTFGLQRMIILGV